jgi:DNA-binding NtrC family response regulator
VEAATIVDVRGHVRASAPALVITESRDADGRTSLPLAVREQPGMARTPLIVHTSWLHLDDELAAAAAGAIAFIAKPCDHRMLLRCVASALRHDGLVSSETTWSEQAGLPLPWSLSVLPHFAS